MLNLASETRGELEKSTEKNKGLVACTDPAVRGITDPVSLSDLPCKFFYHFCIYIIEYKPDPNGRSVEVS